MTSLFENIRQSAKQRAMYNLTVAALNKTTLETRLDLDIYRGDIPEIAHHAVYGR